MDHRLIYWLLIRVTMSLSVFALTNLSLTRKRRNSQRPTPKTPLDAPNGLPILGHALSFSSDMAGFTMKLK